ncbi:hypothetical protein ACFTSD_01450 [Nocardiaceae bacterium NPDC056970]
MMLVCDCGTWDHRHDYGCSGWREQGGRGGAGEVGGAYHRDYADVYNPDGTRKVTR